MTDEATGQQDQTGTGTDPVATATPTGAPTGVGQFNQADVDAIVRDRLARQKRQTESAYADYEDLQAKAARLAEIEEATKSEADKMVDALAAAQAEVLEAKAETGRMAQERSDALLRSAVVSKATTLGFRDPSDVVALLDMAALELQDDGTVTGADDALKALGESKPYLLGTINPKLGPTAHGRGVAPEGETREQKRARIYENRVEDPFSAGAGGGYIPLG